MIRMNDFAADPPALLDAQAEAAARVLRSGWYVLGGEVRRFEAEWAARCGLAHAVGTANGMDAIEIGLRALGIGAGHEVITSAMTAFATVLGILRAGASPVLADIDPHTALLDPASVERSITPRTRAVLLVHLYGQVRDMEDWAGQCARRGLALLEDCAQAHDARWNGVAAGAFGAWGAYSFYPTKNLGAAGDAGALVTGAERVAERARMLRNYGQADRYEHLLAGLNSRLDEMHAAMLSERLAWLDRFTRRRREIAARYRSGIDNPRLRLLAPPRNAENDVHHLFVVCCDERDRLAHELRARGVETFAHYPVPVHRQPPAAALARDPAGLAAAERHAATCLSLPCHPNLGDTEADAVIDALNAFR